MTDVAQEAVESLIDPRRIPLAPRREAPDGILDLLPASSRLTAKGRRLYSDRPFDHHAPAEDPGAFDRALSPLARALGTFLPSEGVVLEVGCGPGHMTAWLRAKGIPVVALDQSIESLRILRQRTNAPAVAADATALPFSSAAFDAVLADGVVHHASRPAAALRELARVLRPGGLLFVRIYRAEGRYPAIYRSIGGLLRMAAATFPLDALVWRLAYPAYRFAANRRYRRRREEPGRHDEGVFSDYFLTPRATPMRGSALLCTLRRLGLDIVNYEDYRNVHGLLARKRGTRPR